MTFLNSFIFNNIDNEEIQRNINIFLLIFKIRFYDYYGFNNNDYSLLLFKYTNNNIIQFNIQVPNIMQVVKKSTYLMITFKITYILLQVLILYYSILIILIFIIKNNLY